MTVDVVTFGCRLNAYEAEVVRNRAQEAGIKNAVIVNTCAVTEEAVRQSYQAIRRIRRERPDTPIVVTGCAAQIEPQRFANLAEVSLVLGNEEKLNETPWRNWGGAFEHPGAPPHEKVLVNDIMGVKETAIHLADGFGHRARAFVQVQNGCDHRCTFCIIPYGRGNSRSVPVGEVVQEVRRLCARGYQEIVLTGVDLTGYGSNLPGSPRLGYLVKQILKHVPELPRLRLSSIDAVEADRDLFDAFATQSRLMPHLHLSLQAGDDLVLKRMKRRHSRADAIGFCAQLRALRPDIVFGADLIAGFPTESERMFTRSLELIDACALTHLHVFPFSPRPGTPAARMPQVARSVIKERAQRLRHKGTLAVQQHLEGEIGRTVRVLVESTTTARTEQFTPVRLGAAARSGTILHVPITGHDGRSLLAAAPDAC
jgi:threonylcarbamoyladenosine tRNA methylthiotransferase MtaB